MSRESSIVVAGLVCVSAVQLLISRTVPLHWLNTVAPGLLVLTVVSPLFFRRRVVRPKASSRVTLIDAFVVCVFFVGYYVLLFWLILPDSLH